MNLVVQQQRIQHIVERIRTAQERIGYDCMEIGVMLQEVKDNHLYRVWDEQATFDDFCEDIRISRTMAYQCMAVVKYFGHTNIEGIAFDRLVQLLPLKPDENEAEEWVEKARELPARGFRDEVKAARQIPGEAPIDECGHANVKTVCADCGVEIK